MDCLQPSVAGGELLAVTNRKECSLMPATRYLCCGLGPTMPHLADETWVLVRRRRVIYRGREPHFVARNLPSLDSFAERQHCPRSLLRAAFSCNCSHIKHVLPSPLLRKVRRWCRLQLCQREASMEMDPIVAAVCYHLPRHRSVHKGAYR